MRVHGHGFTERDALSGREQADEALLMGLRLAEGLDTGRLADLGQVAVNPETLAELSEMGLLAHDAERNRLKATASGRFMLNELVLQLSATFRDL